ncbi:hypothetical protein Tco_0595511 [Tanacetum coccineum]
MEILDTMISDAIKKSAGYNYYIAKKNESAKDKIVDEPEEQPVSPVKNTYAEWGQKLKGHVVKDLAVPSLLDLWKGSKASKLESLKQKKQAEKENETDDADASDMDLSNDNPDRGNDAAGFGMFIYNNSTETPNSTYLSPIVTSSSLDFIQNLLNETPTNELTDLVSNPVYNDAHTTSMVIYPVGNPELTSYISGASEVPIGTHVDVQALNVLL